MLNVAQLFARLMDENRYPEAGAMLAEDCLYFYEDAIIAGRDKIIGTYTANYNKAAAKLDEIVFSSEVFDIGDGALKICYFDRLRKGEQSHEHRCEQVIKMNAGKIVEIRHYNLPGEKETLKTFFDSIGLSWRSRHALGGLSAHTAETSRSS